MVHGAVGVGQFAYDAILDVLEVGLPGEVAGKEEAGADLVLVEVFEKVDTLDAARLLEGDREAEPGRIAVRGGLGNIQEGAQAGQARLQQREVALAGGDELRRALELRQTAGGLHVGDLEVVAEVGVDVFVIVALRQGAELLAESLATGIVTAGGTVAVAAPVAEGFGNGPQLAIVGEHRTALAHSDVVRGVEAEGGDVAQGANHPAIEGGAKCVTAVLDQPQAMLVAQGLDFGEVEGVAQGVGQHDGLGLGGDGGFDELGVDVVSLHIDVDEDRDGTELHDGVDGGGEACSHADDFVTLLDGALAELGRGERAECHQVGRRA